jgi:hypothetical protein
MIIVGILNLCFIIIYYYIYQCKLFWMQEFESEKAQSTARFQSTNKVGSRRERDDIKTLNVDSKEGHRISSKTALSNQKQLTKPNKERHQKRPKVEPRVKEEGEISESEEPQYQRYKEKIDQETKEERWREWCANVMCDQLRTLKRLQKLQTTSVDLPKDEVSMFLMGSGTERMLSGKFIKSLVIDQVCCASHNYLLFKMY